MCSRPLILSMLFILKLMVFSLSVVMVFTRTDPNNFEIAFMQYFDMQYIVPEKEPLFNETIPLMQCMVLCLSMSSCLSVFVSNKNTCNGYHFTHRHPTGIQFHRSEDDSYFYKGNICKRKNLNNLA